MNSNRIKNSITYVFLALFLTVKMAGLHSLLHAHDEGHEVECVICDQAIVSNLTPAPTPESLDFTIKNTELIVENKIAISYNFIVLSTINLNHLFSRPPPFLV